MNKITKKEAFTAMLEMPAIAEVPEFVEILEKEVEKLSKPRPLTAVQKANLVLVEQMKKAMQPNTVYTYKNIVELAPEFAELSAPKVAALMKKLVEEGEVVKKDTKPVSYELV